jgi:hypothetical protein
VSRVPRNALLAGATLLVFIAVAAAVDLQIIFQSRSTQSVWALTHSVVAGDLLGADNVRRVQIPLNGASSNFYTGDLLRAGRRAEHKMQAGTIVYETDLLTRDTSLVTLSLKTPPPVGRGDTVDVYAFLGDRTRIVGRNLAVDSTNGSNFAVRVPTEDEPYWITLQANNVALYAAKSQGVGVPQGTGHSVSDAVSSLGGGTFAPGGAATTPGGVTASPTPAPGGSAVPRGSPQPVVSPSASPR